MPVVGEAGGYRGQGVPDLNVWPQLLEQCQCFASQSDGNRVGNRGALNIEINPVE